jgi:hypothetical protein
MQTPNWKNANIDLVREAVAEGNAKLAAQLGIATSADQRASVLAGIYIAAAAGIIGAIAALAGKLAILVTIGGGAAAISFVVGAFLCIFAMLPVKFWTAGNEPEEWYKDITNNTPMVEALGEQCEFVSRHIHANNRIIERNASRFLFGAIIGAVAPIIGVVVAGITCLLELA